MTGDWLSELFTRTGWTAEDFDRVVRSACGGLHPADADDVYQEVARALGTAFRAGIPAGLSTRERAESYVVIVARNTRWKFLRKRSSQHRRLAQADSLDVTDGTKKPGYDTEPQKAAVLGSLTEDQRERILALLPDDWRRLKAFLRLSLAGMDGKDIARELGTSPATVCRRLADCEEYLDKDCLADILGADAPHPLVPD